MEEYCEILLFLENLIKEERKRKSIFLKKTKKLKWLEKLYQEKLIFLEKLIDSKYK